MSTLKAATPEIKKLLRRAKAAGWSATISGGGHIRLQHPEGGLIFGPMTPSDHRSYKNFRSELKKRGINVGDC